MEVELTQRKTPEGSKWPRSLLSPQKSIFIKPSSAIFRMPPLSCGPATPDCPWFHLSAQASSLWPSVADVFFCLMGCGLWVRCGREGASRVPAGWAWPEACRGQVVIVLGCCCCASCRRHELGEHGPCVGLVGQWPACCCARGSSGGGCDCWKCSFRGEACSGRCGLPVGLRPQLPHTHCWVMTNPAACEAGPPWWVTPDWARTGDPPTAAWLEELSSELN